jgi:hypothetical protein
VRFLAVDHVLVSVVEVVVTHRAGTGLVAMQQRNAVGCEIREQLLQFVGLHVELMPFAFPCR